MAGRCADAFAGCRFAVLALAVLLGNAVLEGMPRLDANLFTQYSSQLRPRSAGARAAILGSAWVIATTAALAIPLGVAAAVYLEEFADKTPFSTGPPGIA